MTITVVFGVDGVLSNPIKRIQKLRTETRDGVVGSEEYFTGAENDSVIKGGALMLGAYTRLVDEGLVSVELWTTRPEAIRALTVKWLYTNLGLHKPILRMRDTLDYRNTAVIKRGWLVDARPDLIIDSNASVVQTAMKLGIPSMLFMGCGMCSEGVV